ncbi:MAG: leucyl aminopeptidase [Alphaproteobacteria bacterium]|nr:leucyl aminopeptidase [Alphaproteobacteria bacterium]
MITLSFTPRRTAAKSTAALAIFVADDRVVAAKEALGNAASYVAHALETAAFKGKKGETLTLLNPGANPSHLLVIGLGKASEVTPLILQESGALALAAALSAKVTRLDLAAALPKNTRIEAAAAAANLAYGAKLRAYAFDKYRTKIKPEDKPKLTAVHVITANADKAKTLYAPLAGIAESVALTRDIVSEPANVIYPATLAAECKKLEKLGVKVEIMGEAAIKKLGMGALLGVGQGSVRESQLVVMQWHGGKKGDKPVALVGKGVTFDTGGISIKPSNGMEEMKWDMGGSATVIGTMRALAARKAKANVVGVVGLVENMPDGNAQRPGDVVTSMSGQTIEVINTDAEGRLVLADALWYTQNRFKPACMLDLATLTGAIIVCLGSHRAGLFSNNDKMAAALAKSAERTGEKLWRMPLGEEYDKMINCDIADMQNVGEGREAGSTTAAQFLQRFVNDVPWVHLDIAGVAWQNKQITPLAPKGAVGWGVRLLNDWIEQNYEA